MCAKFHDFSTLLICTLNTSNCIISKWQKRKNRLLKPILKKFLIILQPESLKEILPKNFVTFSQTFTVFKIKYLKLHLMKTIKWLHFLTHNFMNKNHINLQSWKKKLLVVFLMTSSSDLVTILKVEIFWIIFGKLSTI